MQVSPANTDPLYQGRRSGEPETAYPGYFRTCTNGCRSGSICRSKYLLDQGIKKIATIHDKKTYGQGLAAAVTEAYKSGGGEIVAAETINPDDNDFSAVISKVKGAKPEAVYYGGEYPQAGPLSQQAKSAGLNVPLMGGDGIFDPAFIELAARPQRVTLRPPSGRRQSRSRRPSSSSPTTRQLASSEPYAAYGAYSYDAANAIINASEDLAGQRQ